MNTRRGLAACLLSAALSACATAPRTDTAPVTLETRTATDNPADVQLISESAAIAPGRPFTLALRIKHPPGFHTYWRFAGVVGLPTTVEWSLPPGFEAGPLQWPVPIRSRMAGHTVWGYESDAWLLAELTAPARLQPGTHVTLIAKAAWMACGSSCHPGYKTLRLTLPVQATPTARADRAADFARARAALPREAPSSWTVRAAVEDGQVVLRCRGPRRAEGVYFFNANAQVDSNMPQTAGLENGELVIRMHRWAHAEPAAELIGVLHRQAGWDGNAPQAVRIAAPLTGASR